MVKNIRYFNGERTTLFGALDKKYLANFKKDTKLDSPRRVVRAIKINTGLNRGKYAVYLGFRKPFI